jgi:glycosyltransferase involved in cell wall biosynthesis
MRIGVDIQTTLGRKTGFGFYVSNLVKNLEKIDKKNSYLFIKPESEQDFSTPMRWVWDQIIFPRLARKQRVDILHQPCFSTPIFYRGKVVVTIHDLISVFFGHNIPFWSRQFFGKWMPFTYRFADHLIAVSEHTKKDAIRVLGIPEDKITVIHEAADECYRVITDEKQIAAVRKKYDLGDDPFILHVGTLEPRKNLPFLVRAFAIAKQQNNLQAKLVITGKKGWYYEGLFQLVDELKLQQEVIFTGYVDGDDIPALYNAAKIFAFPSLYEGFGLPPLEAMASGTPVISSNTSSMPEVIGDAGVLLPPEDESQWAAAIVDLLTDEKKWELHRKKGLIQAKRFSWERCAAETVAVYEKVAGAK